MEVVLRRRWQTIRGRGLAALCALLWAPMLPALQPAEGSAAAATPASAPRHAAAPEKRHCPPTAPVLTGDVIAKARAEARDHGLLWRAEKDGRVSWLYGTLHVARLEWLVPGERTSLALQASDTLALELNPLDLDSLRALTEPVDPGLTRRVLTESRRKRLMRAMNRACVSATAYARMRPAMQVSALSLMAGRESGLHAEFAVDTVLAGLAQRTGKPIVALESAAEQIALLAGRNEAEEAELVDGGLDEIESGLAPAMLQKLAAAWARGDEALLANYPEWCRCVRNEAERDQLARLLDDRNGPMADKIAALHAGGQRVFAAVGALHMVGPLGLPNLLRARGFKVDRQTFRRVSEP